MQSVVIGKNDAGNLWAKTKCMLCGEVCKYAPADVFADFVTCKACNRPMQMSGEIVSIDPDEEDGMRLWNVRDAFGRGEEAK
jgi:hypothetical protein